MRQDARWTTRAKTPINTCYRLDVEFLPRNRLEIRRFGKEPSARYACFGFGVPLVMAFIDSTIEAINTISAS